MIQCVRVAPTPQGNSQDAKKMREGELSKRRAKGPDVKGLRFITRMEYARTTGWWVRITASGKNVAQKLFSDKSCGGTEQALLAAKEWRDKQLETNAKLGLKHSEWRIHGNDSRNISGVVGVAPEIERRGKTPYVTAWRAAWPAKNGRQYYRFSVYNYGYQGAFAKAVAYRCEQLGLKQPVKRAPPEWKILAALDA